MGLFSHTFNSNSVGESLNSFGIVQENFELRQDVQEMQSQILELEESLLKISDSFDNMGFKDLIAAEEITEIPLKTVKKMSEVSRAIVTMNPFVKRGVKARIAYVWGKGVQFDKVEKIQDKIDANASKLFTAQAYEELELAAATDGNVFRAIPIDNERNGFEEALALRIPLSQIVDAVSNPDDLEEIWYYKREVAKRTTNPRTGEVETKEEIRYYVSMPYFQKLQRQGKPLPKTRGGKPIDQNYVMQHVTVNRQVGWRWGVPDVAAVISWAQAYKSYLEDNTMLVKAYSRLAWQFKGKTQQGAQAAAAQVMSPPTRDPITGQLRDVGGTAVGTAGMEMTPMDVKSSQVDFSKGTPLASAIASGLEVSLIVITSDPGSGNRSTAETLDLPTLKAMESRQLLWSEAFKELFEFWGDKQTIVTWPQIYNDSTKDRVAAIGTLDELGLIFPEEARKEAVETLGIAPMKPWNVLPDPADDPRKQYAEQQAEKKLETAQANAEDGSVIPGQGKSGGISAQGGAMSTANSARDNREKDSNNS